MLRRAMHEYTEHYHLERNHQGLANQLIVRPSFHGQSLRPSVVVFVSGMLSYYERAAA